MHTRAEHWVSIGMITSICNLDENTLITEVSRMGDTFVQRDRHLTQFLKDILMPGSYIRVIMDYHIYRMKGQLEDNEEFSVDPLVNVETHNDEKGGEVYVYTTAIAVTFHRLLVSSLLSYVFRLRIVDKAVRAFPVNPPDEVITAFLQLLLSAQLLFAVSNSKLFRKHSSLFNDLLSIPTEDRVRKYTQDFEAFTQWHANSHVDDKLLIERIGALATSKDSPQPQASAVKDSAVQASATEASASEELDAGTTDEVLDSAQSEVGVVYRRWIMGMVDHFTSIRVLERVCGKLPPKGTINFCILGLNRPKKLPSGSWAMMVGEIRKLCEDGSLASKASETPLPPDLADKVIEIIETKIYEYEVHRTVNKTSSQFESRVYKFFPDLLSKRECNFTGRGHCEAILMAIIHRIQEKNDLDFPLEACSL